MTLHVGINSLELRVLLPSGVTTVYEDVSYGDYQVSERGILEVVYDEGKRHAAYPPGGWTSINYYDEGGLS